MLSKTWDLDFNETEETMNKSPVLFLVLPLPRPSQNSMSEIVQQGGEGHTAEFRMGDFLLWLEVFEAIQKSGRKVCGLRLKRKRTRH